MQSNNAQPRHITVASNGIHTSTDTYTLIDTTEALVRFLDGVTRPGHLPPTLYVDLEGDELSKNGTLTIIAILIHPDEQVYIIDIQKLQSTAFSTIGYADLRLKGILEASEIPKVFFDVRNDSNALFFLYGIRLGGVQDIQLMENASRTDFGRGGNFRRLLAGLGKCIEKDAGLSSGDLAGWKAMKSMFKARFDAPASVHVFAKRPLDAEALQYCAEDVRLLPRLRTAYWNRLTPAWKSEVERETIRRVRESQTVSYVPRGQHKAVGPW